MTGPPSAILRAKRSMAFGSNAAGLVGGAGTGGGGGGAGGRATATQTRTNLSVLCHARAPPRPPRHAIRTTLSKLIPDSCLELRPLSAYECRQQGISNIKKDSSASDR